MVAEIQATPAIDPSPLTAGGLPAFFEIADFDALGLERPLIRRREALRVWARSLSPMQKEAIVYSTATARAWRLASDEGPYLNGDDAAPCPLAFMSTGIACSLVDEATALAAARDIEIRSIEIVVHSRYTMEGSALRGTMTAGALPPAIEAHIDSPADTETLERLMANAARYSPLNGLIRHRQRSLFALVRDGRPTALGRARPIVAAERPVDPAERFAGALPATAGDPALVTKLAAADSIAGIAGGAGSSLTDQQSRQLHVEVRCRYREDGLKVIEQRLHSPLGSTFQFLSDAPDACGGRGGAPDALTYAAAGLAFCYMTQLGRYATIVRGRLDGYRVVQDTHFSAGGGTGGTGEPGSADPVETHVFLDSADTDEFARSCVDMGEQTCFLHALCRSALEPRAQVIRTP